MALAPEITAPRPGARLVKARAELTLVHGNLEPLGDPAPQDPDVSPLWRLLHGLVKLDPAFGERARVALDLHPLTPRQRARLRRRLARRAARDPAFAGLGAIHGTTIDPANGPEAPQTLEQSLASRALAERLRQLENAFEIQVLIGIEARGHERARWALQVVTAGFDMYTGRNSFQVHGLNVLGLSFLSSAELPGLRQFFDLRFRTGMFFPIRRRVVSAYEMRHFFGPILLNSEMGAPDNYIHRLQGGQVLETVEPWAYRPNQLPTGLIYSRTGGIEMAASRVEDARLSFTAARTGSGKTEFALNEFVQYARNGHGCLLLHPHPDNLDRVRPYITPAADRLIEVNLARDPATVPGWNPFDMAGRSAQDIETRAQVVLSAFRSVLHWGDPSDETRADRSAAVIRMAVHTLLELAVALPDGLTPTIFQLPRLVFDDGWRDALVPLLSPGLQRFWATRFKRPQEDTFGPVSSIIEQLGKWPAAATMLSARRSTYDIRAAMDDGKAVLLCPGGFTEREVFVANLFAFDLFHHALARKDLPIDDRRPFYPIIDHVDLLDGAGNDEFGHLLSRALQYQVYPHLVSEHSLSLNPQTVQAILANDSRIMVGSMDPDSVETMMRDWPHFVYSSAEIINLDRYAFLVAQVGASGRLQGNPYQVTTVALDYLWRDRRDAAGVPDLIRSARRNSGEEPVTKEPPDPGILEERIREWAVGQQPAPVGTQPLSAPERAELERLRAEVARLRADRAPEPARRGKWGKNSKNGRPLR